MIIYIFNEEVFLKVPLPSKISGMYPIVIENKLIANVISNKDKWYLKLTDEYCSEDLAKANNVLNEYDLYKIQSNYGNSNYYFILEPKYDDSFESYEIFDEITIGNNPRCSIYYPNFDEYPNGNDVLYIKRNKTGKCMWQLKTNSNSFYLLGKNMLNTQNCYVGDYIFFYGLRVIILNNEIRVNNPNNKVQVHLQKNPLPKNFELPLNAPKIEIKPLFEKKDYFFKAPRFSMVVETEQVKICEPPDPIIEDETPFILVIGPQITMLATSVLSMISFLVAYFTGDGNTFRLIISLLTIGITILGAILWPYITRKLNKKYIQNREKKRISKYTKYLESKEKEINTIKTNQKSIVMQNHPSINDCVAIINNKNSQLWQRNIDHEDFLDIRVGIGNMYTDLQINVPEEEFILDETDELKQKMENVIKNSLLIENVPITYKLTDSNISAVVGEKELTKKFLDCLFLQMMTFHSYSDLKIVVYTKNEKRWEFLKIIPHCWDNRREKRYFSTTIEDFSAICAELEKVFEARIIDDDEVKLENNGEESSKKNYLNYRPYYLFFIDDMTSARNVVLINKILHYRKNMGFSIIMMSESISTLPSETTNFICVSEHDATIVSSKVKNKHNIFQADFNDGSIDLYECAWKLANIPILLEKEKYELPTSLSFLELYGLGRIEQLNSLSRWSDNNPVNSLSVPVGVDQTGEIFKMDIHEKAYGPHGLIAGTTGSGKSEWIITYILSLAVNFSPNEVQFVLIDYKGGGLAKSFENEKLNIKLPHLAGIITNIDKSEINRSIAALESELKRRENIFNKTRETLKEGSMNIYKYQSYFRKGLVEEPLSHLLIICDEFAELKHQQPEFMDQLISISRIGRSLGIHLILATQKPSGVVNDQIWSNSKFKVCLKVQDKGDSNEILKKPDAAFLKQTGAFYLQVGNDDYYNLGQSAWSGAKYYPSDVLKKDIDNSIEYIDNIGRTKESYAEIKSTEKRECKGEELINIVAYLSNISKEIDIKTKSLWLANMPAKIMLDDLYKKYNYEICHIDDYKIIIGEYDEPRRQEQGLLKLDLEGGNIAIINQDNRADTLITTIIWSSVLEKTPWELAYYIIDFGTETLKKFIRLPHVGEVIFQDEADKVGSLLDMILEIYDERKDLLSDYNGSFTYYNKVNENKIPLIVMVINNYDIFIETFPRLSDLFTTLFRDTAKYGIIFIVSTVSPNALRQRQLQYFNHVIVMQLKDDYQYRNITNCRKNLIPKKVLGRGLCKLDSNDADSYCEFQTAMIAPEEKELEVIKNYSTLCEDFYKYKVKQLPKIPDDFSSADLVKHITTIKDLPIGVDFYENKVSKINLTENKLYLITGKNIEKNMPFIYGLTTILSKNPNVKIRVVDLMGLFKEPILDIKLFNDNFDVVFAALEKDILTRTDIQDYGINIIIGISKYKSKLSKGGKEIFNNLFNHISKSKKSIYILIDDYEKIRMLKLEEWFDIKYCDNGIWLGKGANSQSFLNIEKMSNEDKKYDFEGLAYVIENKKYRVIKTMLEKKE